MSSPHWTKLVKIHACEVTENIVITVKLIIGTQVLGV